jgi:biotin carboxylase
LIIVLSGMKSWLEETLVARGEEIAVVVPDDLLDEWKTRDFTPALYGIPHWTDYEALAGLAARLGGVRVRSVVTVDEPAVRAAAFLRALLGVPGQDLHSAVAFTDKAVMKDRLRAAGLPVVPHRVVHTLRGIPLAAAEVGWPVVVKPRDGFGTINTHLVRDEGHFDELIRGGALGAAGTLPHSMQVSATARSLEDHPGGFLVEAAVGQVVAEYHCELLVEDGRERYCVPARYEAPCIETVDGSTGSVVLAAGPRRERIAELTRAAAAALGLTTGFAHCEVLEDAAGRLFIGEIGARPGGAQIPHLLSLQHGISVADLAADLAQGIPARLGAAGHGRAVSWRSVPMPTGRITAMQDPAQIRALPQVLDVKCSVAVGDDVRGFRSSLNSAAHVFCEGETDELAQRRAAEVAHAWRFECA